MAQISPAGYNAAFYAWDTMYQQAYLEPQTFYQEFASIIPSTTDTQVHLWMDVLPSLSQWQGDRFISSLEGRAYKLQNQLYQSSFSVQRAAIEDDQYGMYAARIQMLARAAKKWPDQVVTTAVQNGLTALCFDGQPFFGTHPQDMSNPNSPTYSNRFDASVTGGGIGFPLNAQNLLTVTQAMMAYKGADNAPLGVIPTHLLVPPQLWGTAQQLTQLQLIAQAVGSNVAATQSSVTQGMLKPLLNTYFADQSRWYVLAVDGPLKPFIWQIRNPAEMSFLNRPDDYNSWTRDEWLFGVRGRGAAGYSLPFLAATASPNATSPNAT